MKPWAGVALGGAVLGLIFTVIQVAFFRMEPTVAVSVGLAFWFGWIDREVAQ